MADNFPPELLQADGTIPAERATAALAVLKLMEGETFPRRPQGDARRRVEPGAHP